MKNFKCIAFLVFGLHFYISGFSQVSLDASFGDNGKVIVSHSIDQAAIYSVKLQPDGKIITCSLLVEENLTYPVVSRFFSDGNLDESFGTNGHCRTSISSVDPADLAMILQDDGKILVTGTHQPSTFSGDFVLQRLNNDGSPDLAFGINSVVITDMGGYNEAKDLVIQPDHKIVVGGFNNATFTGENYSIARYNPDGSLDETFGNNGKSIIDFSLGNGHVASEGVEVLKLQHDGKIVIAGYNKTGGHKNFTMIRLHPNGTLDTAFGDLGQVVLNFGVNEEDRFSALIITSDNKYVAAGNSYNQETRHSKMVFVRLHENGSFDDSFGSNGVSAIQISTAFQDRVVEIIEQENGKILAGGLTMGNTVDYLLLRLNNDGNLDSSFNTTGYFQDFAPSNDVGYSMALQNDRSLILGGATQMGGNVYASMAKILIGEELSAVPFEKSRFVVYPNPASSYLNLSDGDNKAVKNVDIFNMLGQLMLTNNSKQIDISGLPSGNYVAKIDTRSESQTVKFTKN